jgi:hypothetical protein
MMKAQFTRHPIFIKVFELKSMRTNQREANAWIKDAYDCDDSFEVKDIKTNEKSISVIYYCQEPIPFEESLSSKTQ